MKSIIDVLDKWEFDWDSEKFYFSNFLTYKQMKKFLGRKLLNIFTEEIVENFDKKSWRPISFTRKNILDFLKKHIEHGFEKALDDYPDLSIYYTYNIVRLLNWILEEGLESWDEKNYNCYGLPLFKATAVKYEWDNPIGNDKGFEYKYTREGKDESINEKIE